MMDTRQLRDALRSNPTTRGQLGVVCPADQLPPTVLRRPRLYIVNTDVSSSPGKHWVTFYFPKRGPAEFFDPIGHEPEYYHRRFRNVLLANGSTYIYNGRRLQGVGSIVCGQFCLYYAYHRCNGSTMGTIVNQFSGTDLTYNNEKVVSFYDTLRNAI